jgi:hypothetical protein
MARPFVMGSHQQSNHHISTNHKPSDVIDDDSDSTTTIMPAPTRIAMDDVSLRVDDTTIHTHYSRSMSVNDATDTDDDDNDELRPLTHALRSLSSSTTLPSLPSPSSSSSKEQRSKYSLVLMCMGLSMIMFMFAYAAHYPFTPSSSTKFIISVVASPSPVTTATGTGHADTSLLESGCMMGTYADPNRSPSRGDIRDRGGCFECPINHYCAGGGSNASPLLPVPCFEGSFSPAGSHTIASCQCQEGTYVDYEEGVYDGTHNVVDKRLCRPCRSGSFCTGNGRQTHCGMDSHWLSPVGSISVSNCTCPPSRFPRLNGYGGNGGDRICSICPIDHECHNGLLHVCPPRSRATEGATECLCVTGTYLVKGSCQGIDLNSLCCSLLSLFTYLLL